MKDTADKIRAIVAKYDPLKSVCFSLYVTLIFDQRYGPSMEGQLTLGFVATTSTASETFGDDLLDRQRVPVARASSPANAPSRRRTSLFLSFSLLAHIPIGQSIHVD